MRRFRVCGSGGAGRKTSWRRAPFPPDTRMVGWTPCDVQSTWNLPAKSPDHRIIYSQSWDALESGGGDKQPQAALASPQSSTEEGGRFLEAWTWTGSGMTSPARSEERTTCRFVKKMQLVLLRGPPSFCKDVCDNHGLQQSTQIVPMESLRASST